MTEKDFRRVEVLRDAGRVKRLHTVDTLTEHTIERHVYGSMIIAVELCRLNTTVYQNDILRLLLVHDAPELDTGDVPAPVKRSSLEITDALFAMEEAFYDVYEVFVPNCDSLAGDIVKASDTLDLAFAMLYEARRGNKHPRIKMVFHNCMEYLKAQYHVRGVKEFTQHLDTEFRYAFL